MQALRELISPIKIQNNDFPNKNLSNLNHLRISGWTVYVFLHVKECTLKSTKWNVRALKEKLVRFDGHIIYRIYIKDQNKVIRVKNLGLFEDTLTKAFLALPDFNRKSMFNVAQIPDEESPSDKSNIFKNKKLKPKHFQKLRKT